MVKSMLTMLPSTTPQETDSSKQKSNKKVAAAKASKLEITTKKITKPSGLSVI